MEAFKHLTPEQMTFVVLVADYNSPLKALMVDENMNLIKDYERVIRMQASYAVGVTKGKGKDDYVKGRLGDVEKAISYYQRWQGWDSLKLQMRLKAALAKSIDELEEEIDKGDIFEEKGGFTKALSFSKQLYDIDKEIDKLISNIPDFVSFIEDVMEADIAPEVNQIEEK